jgi:hypothetical protein
VFPPGVAVAVPPLQLVPAPGELAINVPRGNVSVSGALRVAIEVLGLNKVTVRSEIPPLDSSGMEAGVKDLTSVGAGSGKTVKVATAGKALLPLLVCKAPAISVSM